MKNIFLVFFISITFLACEKSIPEKTLMPRPFKRGEQFNDYPKSNNNIFNLKKIEVGERDQDDKFQVNFNDTLITVANYSNQLITSFLTPRFLNSQKTAIMVQAVDRAGLASSFYVLSTKNGKLEAIELVRPSRLKRKTTGMEEFSRSSFIINNDFVITTINGKVYPIKRQDQNDPIDGKIFMVSKDGSTLIFLTADSFYQYNYVTDESFNLPVNPNMLKDKAKIYKNVQKDFSWFKNANGALFLKQNVNDDRIVDIKEFKH